ncbi:MAG: protein kinase domain-containing protein [Planctomycetota bacterium]|jgi:hypothetical protein
MTGTQGYMEGRHLAGFTILAEVARGDAGVVYRARQASLGRDVALWTPPPGARLEAALLKRLEAEARALSAVSHPNLAEVYDLGCESDTFYMALELVEGTSLEALLADQGAMDYRRATAVASQVAGALDALHASGLLHRGLRPSAVLLRPDGMVKLARVGSALLRDHLRRTTGRGPTARAAHCMSPEAVRGGELDERSDIYSLGTVLYEMLAGEAPFTGDSPLAVMSKHCEEAPPVLRRIRPDVPDALTAIVARCLAKNPEARYQTAEALKADLDYVLLELEFDALAAESSFPRDTSAYGTRTVASLQREAASARGPIRRAATWLRRRLRSVVSRAAAALERDLAAQRQAARTMGRVLVELAAVKQRQAEQPSGAGDLAAKVEALEAAYREAREKHDRLRARVELKQAEAVRKALSARAAGKRRRTTAVGILLVAAALLAAVLITPRQSQGERNRARARAIREAALQARARSKRERALQADSAPPPPGRTYEIAGRPQGVKAADFDGDGHLDLACGMLAARGVTVLYGVGDGTFHRREDYDVGLGVVTDLNGDGLPDIATREGGLSILFAQPGGGFAARKGLVPAMHGGANMAVGDFNGDGVPDVAAPLAYTNKVAVAFGLGGGAFAYGGTQFHDVCRAASGIVVRDFDGDSLLDIGAISSDANMVSILYGRMGGDFGRREDRPLGESLDLLASVDLDGDGHLDRITLDTSGNTVNLAYLRPDGRVERRSLPGGDRPATVTTADMDCDGQVDLLVGASGGLEVIVLYGSGDGTFESGRYAVKERTLGIATGDFDGNELPDIATIHPKVTETTPGIRRIAGYVRVVLNPGRLGDGQRALDPVAQMTSHQ